MFSDIENQNQCKLNDAGSIYFDNLRRWALDGGGLQNTTLSKMKVNCYLRAATLTRVLVSSCKHFRRRDCKSVKCGWNEFPIVSVNELKRINATYNTSRKQYKQTCSIHLNPFFPGALFGGISDRIPCVGIFFAAMSVSVHGAFGIPKF